MPRFPKRFLWNQAAVKCGGHCWYCGCLPDDITVDHAKPRSRGGRNVDDNLLPACDYCNNLKADCTISEFRKFCKLSVIRGLLPLGYFNGDLDRLRIVFYGEGDTAPLGW